MYHLNRGQLALMACHNGKQSMQLIKEHIEKLCKERKSYLTSRVLKRYNRLDARNGNNPESLLSRAKRLESWDVLQNFFIIDEMRRLLYKPYWSRQMELVDYVNNFGVLCIDSDRTVFDDGEIRIDINYSVRGMDLYIIQNVFNPMNPLQTSENLTELQLAIRAARMSDAAHVTVVMPYYPYGRQERRQGRQSLGAKTVANSLFNEGADKIISIDLHAPAIEGFADTGHRIEPLLSYPVFLDSLVEILSDNGKLISPDVGAGKTVSHYAKVLSKEMAIGYKYRRPDSCHDSHDQRLLGEVKGSDAAIMDDLISRGGTMLNMIRHAKNEGALDIYSFATFGQFLGDSKEKFRKLHNEGILKRLFVTNAFTYSNQFLEPIKEFTTVLDTMWLFANAIYETNVAGSISRLFPKKLREEIYGSNFRDIEPEESET